MKTLKQKVLGGVLGGLLAMTAFAWGGSVLGGGLTEYRTEAAVRMVDGYETALSFNSQEETSITIQKNADQYSLFRKVNEYEGQH